MSVLSVWYVVTRRDAVYLVSECSRFCPNRFNRFTFGGVIAERVNTVICHVEYFHDRLFRAYNENRLFEPISL